MQKAPEPWTRAPNSLAILLELERSRYSWKSAVER